VSANPKEQRNDYGSDRRLQAAGERQSCNGGRTEVEGDGNEVRDRDHLNA
jgi:hypothetical protein